MTSIILKELKLMLKGKGNFFFLIIMPILFTVIFGTAFGNVGNANITIHYVDQDHSAASKTFLDQIGKIDGFQLKQDSTPVDQQIKQIKNGKKDSLLVIPAGFGKTLQAGKAQAKLKFYRDPASATATAPIQAVLRSMVSQYQKQKLSGSLTAMGKTPSQVNHLLQPPIQIKQIKESGNGNSTITMTQQIVPGYTVMFVFFIILTMVRSFLGEKESGMLSRLRSTPMKPIGYLIGMWIPAVIAVLIQCTVLLGFGHFAYGLDLGDIKAIALIVLCLAISGTGIGLAVSFLVRGENQGRGITMLISLGGAAVAGLWVPYSLLPKVVQKIAHFFPQFWAQQSFQDVMVHGAHLGDVWQKLIFLLAFGVAGLIVALLRFNHFMRTATN